MCSTLIILLLRSVPDCCAHPIGGDASNKQGYASMMSTMEAARATHSACVRRHCAQCKEDVDRVTTHLIDLQNVLEVELTSKVDALQAEKNHASVIIKCAKNTEEIQQSEHVYAQDSATETSETTSKQKTVMGLGTWSA